MRQGCGQEGYRITYENEQRRQSKLRKLQVAQNSCEWHWQGRGVLRNQMAMISREAFASHTVSSRQALRCFSNRVTTDLF